MKRTPKPIIDLPAVIPEFQPLARTTVRLHPRQGITSPQESHMGGPIHWPKHKQWPICPEHDCALIPVLQIKASDMPEMIFPEGKDLFQLLWCPNDHQELEPQYAPWSQVFWNSSEEQAQDLSKIPQSEGESRYTPHSCVLSFERVQEFPSAFEELDELWQKIENAEDLIDLLTQLGDKNPKSPLTAYQYLFSVADGCKIGGYPYWIQDPEWVICECGQEMEYLLTISSAEFDGGTWPRWLPEDERDVWSASYEERHKVQCALGLMIGDMGNINYFICRHCQDWPVASVVQCS